QGREACRHQTFAKGGDHAAGDENEPRHGRKDLLKGGVTAQAVESHAAEKIPPREGTATQGKRAVISWQDRFEQASRSVGSPQRPRPPAGRWSPVRQAPRAPGSAVPGAHLTAARSSTARCRAS